MIVLEKSLEKFLNFGSKNLYEPWLVEMALGSLVNLKQNHLSIFRLRKTFLKKGDI